MGYGIMKISMQALAGILCLPEDYRAITVQQDLNRGDTLTIWLTSPSIPDQPEDEYPLEIEPRYTVYYNPECPSPEYRKIETQVEIRHHKRLEPPEMLELLKRV